MKSKMRTAAVPAVSLLATFATTMVFAQTSDNELQPITVTAQRTGAQDVQRVPIAISVFTGGDLSRNVSNDIRDLAAQAPNITISQVVTSAQIYIRGIGSNNVAPGSDPDVTEQIDGVYIARPSAQLQDFIDVDRVEILRGPQGTLYGRNAVGGTVNVISLLPTDEFVATNALTGGNYALIQDQAYVSGALVPGEVQASIAANYQSHHPYFNNIVPGGQSVGDASRGGIKGILRFEPMSQLELITRADWSGYREHPESYSELIAPTRFPSLANSIVGNYSEVALNAIQLAVSHIGGVSQEINYHAADWLTIKSLTAYRDDSFSLTNDNDSTELQLQFSRQAEEEHSISQEVDFQFNFERFQGIAGYYFFHDHDRQINGVELPPSLIIPPPASQLITAAPLVTSTSNAGFLQGTYQVLPSIAFVAGARYTSDDKTFAQMANRSSLNPPTLGAELSGSPIAFGLTGHYNAVTPKAGINWQVTDEALVYASATRGYKSGGFNFSAVTVPSAAFAPENVWSYEIGEKSQWLDHRLRVNLTAFLYDYKNLQVSQLVGPGTFSIGNAASATGKGAELEVIAKPLSALQLTASLAHLEAVYRSYPAASVGTALLPYVTDKTCVGTACTVDAADKYLNGAPRYTGYLGGDYQISAIPHFAVALHADYSYRTRAFFDPSNTPVQSQAGYGLFNAHVTLLPNDTFWNVELWGKNLGDKKYLTTTAASGVVPDGYAGNPRTYGLRFTTSFR
jgi:iron complex outermembrane recepter protein